MDSGGLFLTREEIIERFANRREASKKKLAETRMALEAIKASVLIVSKEAERKILGNG